MQYPYQQQPIFPPPPPMPPQHSPKKKPTFKETWNSGASGKCGIIFASAVLLLVVGLCSGVMHAATSGSQDAATTASTATTQPTTTTKHVAVAPAKPTPKPKPTAKPAPTQSPAQIEDAYKASTTNTDVVTLDKDGNADMGNDEHFTCTLVAFVKDSSGNTAGANVTDTASSSGSFVQVAFTPGTDVTQLNANDTIEVWGANQGVASGSNAFGATVQEVVIQANYITDQTTGYQANS
jgi:hypothetical protein